MQVGRSVVKVFAAAAVLAAGLALGSPPAHAEGGWFTEYAGAGLNVGGTYTPIVGNFGGDSHDDIIWYAPGPGTDSIWVSNGAGTFAKSTLSKQVNGTYIPVTGQFGGDARDDIFWYAPGSAADSLWLTSGSGTFTPHPKAVSGTYKPVVVRDTDFDPGNNDDIVWYAPGAAADSVWVFTGAGAHVAKPLSVPGSPQPLMGDFNGDGFADLFWYAPGSATDELWYGDGGGTFTKSGEWPVNGTYKPVVQQFTPAPNATSDILWFRGGSASDPLWSGADDGGFLISTQDVPGTGTPIGLKYEWGYVFTWDSAQPDRIWYWDSVPYDHPAANTEIPTGYTPILGRFVSGSVGIFWYKPGTAPERLFD